VDTPQARAGASSMAQAAKEGDAGSLQQQGDHSAAVGNDTPATTTTTTLVDTQQSKAGGVSLMVAVNRDVERDAGSLQLHQQDTPSTTMDTPESSGGVSIPVSMATREKELGGRVVNLGDDVAAVAASQPKCPNLRGILRVAENRRVLMSVIPTLTLAIMGG